MFLNMEVVISGKLELIYGVRRSSAELQNTMIITTTGFFNTGSSAITHMLKEFDSIYNEENVYEVRLLYDPDGIGDLEYHLIDNPHRQNTSYAIKRFKKYIDRNTNPLINHHYEKICKGCFKKISYQYIDAITDFKYNGVSHIDTFDKSVFFCFWNRVYQKILHCFLSVGIKNVFRDCLLPEKTIQYAGTYREEKFLEETRKYVNKLLMYLGKQYSDYVLIDQLVPPSNIQRYIRYFPENEKVKVFVVDRDPRDLYVTCKYFLNSKAFPCDSPEAFCDWFEWTRGQSYAKPDPLCVMRIQFEDLIYEYEETRNRIIRFCELENEVCSRKKQVFKPKLSINNTQVWLRYPEAAKDVKYIYDRLYKYCYNFDSKSMRPDYKNSKMFDC